MARFNNPTGSVLVSQEFGLIPPGEFEAPGYDPDVHGVIPGCTRLDGPGPDQAGAADGDAGGDPKATSKRGKAAEAKETPA